jgi:hypothetical protein
MDWESMTVEQLDVELDRIAQERQALREQAIKIMYIRNHKIGARELRARLNPTPIMGLPDAARIERLRVQAGVAVVGTGTK